MKRFRASPDDQSLSRWRFITSAGATITLPLLPSLLYSRRTGADSGQLATDDQVSAQIIRTVMLSEWFRSRQALPPS